MDSIKFYKEPDLKSENYGVFLSDLLKDCTPDFRKFLFDFLNGNMFADFPADCNPARYDNDDEVVDCLVTIPLASHILYTLYANTKDDYYKCKIDIRINDLRENMRPRLFQIMDE